MRCDQLDDLILFHVGGAADAGESRAVLEHIRTGCPRCAGRLAEAEATMASLPLAIEPVTPSPAVKERLMARVADSARARAVRGGSHLRSVPSPGGAETRPGPTVPPSAAREPSRSRWMPMALAAGLAAILGGLVVYLPMQDERRVLRAALQDQDVKIQALEEDVHRATSTIRLFSNPAIQVVSLGGAQAQPEAAGRIFWDHTRGTWHFYAANMKPSPPGKTYELWFITADQRKVRAGTFDVDASGEGALTTRVPAEIGEIALAAITDEPAGGVDQPTGTIQLVGKITEPGPVS